MPPAEPPSTMTLRINYDGTETERWLGSYPNRQRGGSQRSHQHPAEAQSMQLGRMQMNRRDLARQSRNQIFPFVSHRIA
jgi:hypothetical protein